MIKHYKGLIKTSKKTQCSQELAVINNTHVFFWELIIPYKVKTIIGGVAIDTLERDLHVEILFSPLKGTVKSISQSVVQVLNHRKLN